MKNHLRIILSFLVFSISSQAFAFAPDQVTKKIRVGNFQSLELGSAFEIHITKASSCTMSATGNESDLDELEVALEGSKLKVYLDESYWSNWKNWKGGSKKIILNITMPRLRDAEFNGATKVFLEGFTDEEEMTLHCSGASKISASKLVADKLVIDLSGATKVEMAGRVLKLSVGLSGASHVILNEMVARDVDVDASGASHVELNVQKSLRVDASGASKITYRGNPLNISKDLSGASTVRRAD
jgi:Putative auto-transporter adhesin, head GIN domain